MGDFLYWFVVLVVFIGAVVVIGVRAGGRGGRAVSTSGRRARRESWWASGDSGSGSAGLSCGGSPSCGGSSSCGGGGGGGCGGGGS